jgi:hypothetical protein
VVTDGGGIELGDIDRGEVEDGDPDAIPGEGGGRMRVTTEEF